MAFTHDASCSPVGMAWKKSIELDSALNLYASDDSHPSIYGSYLSACTFYSTIFKKSCIASTYWPNGIDSITALSLQAIATNTVLDSLSAWNIFNADFTYNQIGDSVSFTNLSSNYESVLWDFGDGQTSTAENPTHTYAVNGNYTVTLTAITNAACIQDTQTVSITVNISTAIDEFKAPKQLLFVTDVLGRKTNPTNNVYLLYRYSDGTLEKRIIIE
jgi:PKD repeat protein